MGHCAGAVFRMDKVAVAGKNLRVGQGNCFGAASIGINIAVQGAAMIDLGAAFDYRYAAIVEDIGIDGKIAVITSQCFDGQLLIGIGGFIVVIFVRQVDMAAVGIQLFEIAVAGDLPFGTCARGDKDAAVSGSVQVRAFLIHDKVDIGAAVGRQIAAHGGDIFAQTAAQFDPAFNYVPGIDCDLQRYAAAVGVALAVSIKVAVHLDQLLPAFGVDFDAATFSCLQSPYQLKVVVISSAVYFYIDIAVDSGFTCGISHNDRSVGLIGPDPVSVAVCFSINGQITAKGDITAFMGHDAHDPAAAGFDVDIEIAARSGSNFTGAIAPKFQA